MSMFMKSIESVKNLIDACNKIAPQLGAGEVDVAALLVLDDGHGIPAVLWERLRVRFAA